MRSILAALVLATATILAAGCGSDDETTSYTTKAPPAGGGESSPTPEPTETATEEPTPSPMAEATPEKEEEGDSAVVEGGPEGEEIEIVGTEFAFEPAEVSAKAGRVTLTLDNQGQAPHEIVVLDTDTAPDALPTGDDGTAEEEGNVGETEEIPGGERTSVTLELDAGDYVLICNLPGHYQGGMYGSLTVE